MSLTVPRRGDIVLHRVNETAVIVFDRTTGAVVCRTTKPQPRAHRHSTTAAEATVCPQCGQSLLNATTASPHEYFRLLGRITENATSFTSEHDVEPNIENEPDRSTSPDRGADHGGISQLSLSQGYFDRFFRTLGLLGRGSRAAVYLVEHVLEDISVGKFALKKVPVGNDHRWLQKVLSEVNLLSSLAHPNLVRYNHVWLEISSLSKFGPPVPCAYVLQEYCDGGTLEDFVFKRRSIANGDGDSEGESDSIAARVRRERRRRATASTAKKPSLSSPILSCDEIIAFITDVVRGIDHLHKHGFLHCDLKPSNCLLQLREDRPQPSVLVSDFGESQRIGTRRVGTGSTGTLEYTAPEVLRAVNGKFPAFSEQSDMFSVGMMLHFLCFSQLPYSDAWEKDGDMQRLKEEVLGYSFDFDASNSVYKRQDLGNLVPLLHELLGSPNTRPSAQEVLNRLQTHKPASPVIVPLAASVPVASAVTNAVTSATTAVVVEPPVFPKKRPSLPALPDVDAPPTEKTEGPSVKRRRTAEPLLSPNMLRALKILSLYVLRPPPWALHSCAVLAVVELLGGRSRELFLAHCAILAISLGWRGGS